MDSNLQYIDDYFNGLLPITEKSLFDSRIKSDETFAKEVGFYLQSKQLGNIERKQRFLELNEKIKTSKPQFSIIKGIGAFAAAAALIIIGFWFFLTQHTITVEQYAQNYISEKLNTIDIQMSVENDSLTAVAELYNQKQYNKALNKIDENSLNPLSLEYQGLCYLQLNQYENALMVFSKLSENKEILQNKGLFYQAIVLIKLNKINEAKVILTSIKTTQNAFGKEETNELNQLLK